MAKAATANTGLQTSLKRTLREGVLWVFGAVALIMVVSLVTYHPGDVGPSQSGPIDTVRNGIGQAGAYFADVVYMLFGRPAYLFPVMVMFFGWLAFRERRNPEPLDKAELALRIVGFLGTLATSCGLATLHFSGRGLPETGGGIAGQIVGQGLAEVMSLLGATLLLLALWLAFVSLFSGVSWFSVMDQVGRWALGVWAGIVRSFETMRDRAAGRRAAQERQVTLQAAQQRDATRERPRIEPTIAVVEKSRRAEKERQVPLFDPPPRGELPPLSLLTIRPSRMKGYSEESLEAMSRLVELKLKDFGIDVEVVRVTPARSSRASSWIRRPGSRSARFPTWRKTWRGRCRCQRAGRRGHSGQVLRRSGDPEREPRMVTLGEILKIAAYDELASPLTLALGKDISGMSVVADLARMPHLLIAGTTGSGKSVAINAMVLSLLYKAQPEHVR